MCQSDTVSVVLRSDPSKTSRGVTPVEDPGRDSRVDEDRRCVPLGVRPVPPPLPIPTVPDSSLQDPRPFRAFRSTLGLQGYLFTPRFRWIGVGARGFPGSLRGPLVHGRSRSVDTQYPVYHGTRVRNPLWRRSCRRISDKGLGVRTLGGRGHVGRGVGTSGTSAGRVS